ncbi:hypothetical protein BOX15_Mlig024773g1, partial [Macrostomum lignano]
IRSNQSEVVMATRSEYQKNYRNYTKKAAEEYQEHLRYRQLRKSAEFAHHDWAWSGVEVEDTATPSAASASPPHAVASGSPPKQKAATAAETELKLTDLPPSRRLSKAEPSLSTLSQSGSETDYQEREANLLDDPLAETAEETAAPSPPIDEAAERAKIRRAIRELKLKRQEELQKQPAEQQQQRQQQQQRRRRRYHWQQRRHREPSPPPRLAAGYSSDEVDADEESNDIDETDEVTDDYEEQLAAARRRRLRRRQRQQQEAQQKQKQEQQQQQKQQTRTAAQQQKKPKRRAAPPDCPPLELDRVAEDSAQVLFNHEGQSQKKSLQQQKQQPEAEPRPIFYPWGMGDEERQYGLKRTFNVRATRDVYDSALRARDRCPPSRTRPATAGLATAAGAGCSGGRSATAVAGRLGASAPGAQDDYWLSEYAKNFAKYANALYARNRQALASRARADLL